MVFRPREGEVEVLRIEGGGPVVGLLPTVQYVQCALDLRPSDLLLAFTDGISEALSAQDEEWGEARLVRTAGACLELDPREVVERVMAAVDGFCAGAPQHDDMTLVVVRVKD